MNYNLEKQFREAINSIESEESFTVYTKNDFSFEVGASNCWIGGECYPDDVMTDLLGNISYTDRDSFTNEISDYVENELKDEIVDFD